jgi:hypothetical protein
MLLTTFIKESELIFCFVLKEISVSSLDSAEVKEQCRLSYNLAQEEQSECTVRCESIWVPAPNRKNMKMKASSLLFILSIFYKKNYISFCRAGNKFRWEMKSTEHLSTCMSSWICHRS